MKYIMIRISNTNNKDLLGILHGVTKKMMIPVRMFDSGPAWEDPTNIWIKFEVCDNDLSWDDLKARIDTLNDKGMWAMPCEIELYDTEDESPQVGVPSWTDHEYRPN